jgi:hypothetical protein
MIAAYSSANTYVFDIETAKPIILLESKQDTGMGNITKLKQK